MNQVADFKEWLNKVRFSRNICMLIPMEACMGYPIIVKNGREYIIPFFKVKSVENMDELTPPFAYIRIQYPCATILTYNNLRTLPEWKNIDWNKIALKNERCTLCGIEYYYDAICGYENSYQIADRLDEILLDCLNQKSTDYTNLSPLVTWYKKLIEEAKKYR